MGWPTTRIAAVAAALLLPATPAAALTTTITAPVPGTRIVADDTSPPVVHLAGTASGGAAVDLVCVSSSIDSPDLNVVPIASGVPVTRHAFATDAPWPTDPGPCEVYAVAPDSTPTASDLTGLNGSRVHEAVTETSVVDGKTYDISTYMDGGSGAFGLGSFGACGVSFGELLQQHNEEAHVFDCNGYPEPTDLTSDTTDLPSLVVDGHPAYPPFVIGDDDSMNTLPGWSGVRFAVSDKNDSFRLIAHERLFRCESSDQFPPGSCTGFTPTGVDVDTDDTLSPDGRALTQRLRFVSADGDRHVLAAVLNQTSADARQWRFPGTAAFQDYAVGSAPATIAPAVATIRNRVGSGAHDPDLATGFGAITYASTPAREVFWDPSDAFIQDYPARVIPRGGAARVEFTYSIAAGSSALAGLTAAAEESIGGPPRLSVTSSGSVTDPAYELTGTAAAPETLSRLTIDGAEVPVGADGTFALATTLAEGTNSFTLRAYDELDRVATVPFSVILTTTGPPPPPPPPHSSPPPPESVVFGRSRISGLKGRTWTTGFTATCPHDGPDCTVVALATRAGTRVIANRAITLNARTITRIRLMLGKPLLRLLRRRHGLKVALALTGTRTGATAVKDAAIVRLR